MCLYRLWYLHLTFSFRFQHNLCESFFLFLHKSSTAEHWNCAVLFHWSHSALFNEIFKLLLLHTTLSPRKWSHSAIPPWWMYIYIYYWDAIVAPESVCTQCVHVSFCRSSASLLPTLSLPPSRVHMLSPSGNIDKHELPELNPCPLNFYWSRRGGGEVLSPGCHVVSVLLLILPSLLTLKRGSEGLEMRKTENHREKRSWGPLESRNEEQIKRGCRRTASFYAIAHLCTCES